MVEPRKSGVLVETTGRQRDRTFGYAVYFIDELREVANNYADLL